MKMRLTEYLLLSVILMIFLSSSSFANVKNEKTIGLLLGDPIAVSLKVPVKERNFLNIHAGIWTWSFWHDIDYNTPFLSVDYAWNFPIKQTLYSYYIGAGIGLFFADNPKDENDYDAAAAIRLPLGLEFHAKDNFSMGIELSPIYQILPAYTAHYILELNGGLVLRFSY